MDNKEIYRIREEYWKHFKADVFQMIFKKEIEKMNTLNDVTLRTAIINATRYAEMVVAEMKKQNEYADCSEGEGGSDS